MSAESFTLCQYSPAVEQMREKAGLMLGVVYISVFFVLLSILDVSSGAGACTALLKKSRWSLILRPERFDVQRSIDRVLNSPQSQRPC